MCFASKLSRWQRQTSFLDFQSMPAQSLHIMTNERQHFIPAFESNSISLFIPNFTRVSAGLGKHSSREELHRDGVVDVCTSVVLQAQKESKPLDRTARQGNKHSRSCNHFSDRHDLRC
jgi:hypothetical protein